MSRVYSARFFIGTYQIPQNNVVVATVPAGYVWQVRSATVRPGGAASIASLALYVVTPDGNGALLSEQNPAPHSLVSFTGRAVMYSGETLVLQATGSAGAIWAMASGYQLSD